MCDGTSPYQRGFFVTVFHPPGTLKVNCELLRRGRVNAVDGYRELAMMRCQRRTSIEDGLRVAG